MVSSLAPLEPTNVRRVFAAWSIEVPASLAETFVETDAYWHAHDEHRSVSLTSLRLTAKGRLVSAARIARQIPPLDGLQVDELPPDLTGRATTSAALQPARASQVLSGALAADGRMLIVTITSDDLEWARGVWLSIRGHSAPFPRQREQKIRRDRRRATQ